MKEQAIANMVEGLAELHVEHLKTRKGASFIAYLAKMESEHKGIGEPLRLQKQQFCRPCVKGY